MIVMKSLLKKTFLFAFFLLAAPSVLFASEAYETVLSGLNDSAYVAGFETTSPLTVIEVIAAGVQVLLSLTGLIFLGLIIWAGLRIMFSNGDAGAIKKGRDVIIHALIGIVLILSAYAITTFLFSEVLPGLTGEVTSSSTVSDGTSSADRGDGSAEIAALAEAGLEY
jgi:hypothetical protein